MGRKRNKRSPQQLDGLLILNKPSGPTSAACLNDIKHRLKQYKIGHGGTLDPMAQGVLLVLLGHGTKLAPYLTGGTKTYSGTFRLGISTDTLDIQGEIVQESPVDATVEDVEREIMYWKELTEQEVPAYSAAKHEGKPLYALAREGKETPVKIKPIVISHVEMLDVQMPEAAFRVSCSAGTYIRSLVHSLGTRIGCGATLTSLIRESSEPFGLDQALDLEDVLENPETFPERVIPLKDTLPHWPKYQLTEPLAKLVMNGAWLPVAEQPGELLAGSLGDYALLLDTQGEPLALVEAKLQDDMPKWAILRGLWNQD
ncbi:MULTISPECIES: tRNA pseudouridine(55) synthase TruB [unclassified Pseudodesulfovibrio]|uniref:tRNA pseudouridine(55) synthase TruB n=1 Tax=unclassified Pseudodesulfovibrio TaxID=2661612 RepID=UPI000FEBE3AA|nr:MULTISPECIES: tRNA pseudouridine(55) synthase TruB [unclassified Pseudodesulfovibrio]MCJ2163170.1 tRNA pseudouridine(55) synthase TruB [Pseudodesulfovibrio sp. S3-i]RWU07159.1 tRNA pseudouridine(55) synthase TruB [Pseudodesulfovibrio sp. S3]